MDTRLDKKLEASLKRSQFAAVHTTKFDPSNFRVSTLNVKIPQQYLSATFDIDGQYAIDRALDIVHTEFFGEYMGCFWEIFDVRYVNQRKKQPFTGVFRVWFKKVGLEDL